MKRLIFVLLLSVSFQTKAQYFIPMFQENIDTMGACNLLITDTAHNYLYMGVGDSLWNNRYVVAYDNNTLHQTDFPANQYADIGCVTESGLIAIINQSNLLMISIDSLTAQTNIYGYNQISGFGTNTITSRNDTIYFDADMSFSGDQVVGITSAGTSFTLGYATGGSGITNLEFCNGYLYATGTYTAMNGDTSIKYISYWDGLNWNPVAAAGIDWGGGLQVLEKSIPI